LALGTAVTALGFIALGLACGVVALILLLLLAGAGSGAQHPLCASLVSKAYYGGPQRTALGIYNFSGDIGKMAVPLIAALIITELDWCASTVGYGTVGLLAALAVLLILTRCARVDAPVLTPDLATSEVHVGWGIRNPRGFGVLILIGMLDSASRTEFLTFLPFLLIAKGADVETVRLALALVFGGGAAGKFICGFLAERLGVVRTVILTELITYGGIVLLLPLPLEAALVLLPLVGLGLNGTSSVLYGSIAESFVPERRSRGFGLFYTLGTGAGVVSPFLFGSLGDRIGGNPGNVTSPYDGTALIAAAHLGHHEVVKALVDAGAPLDHVNNLGWTALIEAVILGDGGPRHIGRFGFFWRVAPKSRSSTARAGHPCSTLRCAITRRSRGSFAR